MGRGARIRRSAGLLLIIDINMACPARRYSGYSGSAPDARPRTLRSRCRVGGPAHGQVPVTLKDRGWGVFYFFDDADAKRPPIWPEGRGGRRAGLITIHGARAEFYKGPRRLGRDPAALKERLQIPVIANGDITDCPKALAEGVAPVRGRAVMVGRGAQRAPLGAGGVGAALHASRAPQVPGRRADRTFWYAGHFEAMLRLLRPRPRAGVARKHLGLYLDEAGHRGPTCAAAVLTARGPSRGVALLPDALAPCAPEGSGHDQGPPPASGPRCPFRR